MKGDCYDGTLQGLTSDRNSVRRTLCSDRSIDSSGTMTLNPPVQPQLPSFCRRTHLKNWNPADLIPGSCPVASNIACRHTNPSNVGPSAPMITSASSTSPDSSVIDGRCLSALTDFARPMMNFAPCSFADSARIRRRSVYCTVSVRGGKGPHTGWKRTCARRKSPPVSSNIPSSQSCEPTIDPDSSEAV